MKHISLPTGFINDLGLTSTTDEILNVVARWLPEIMGSDRGSITLATQDRKSLNVYAMQGSQAINMGVVLPVENTLLGRAYCAKQTINFSDVSIHSDEDAVRLLASGLRSCLISPLLSNRKCYGTVNIAHHDTDHFDEEAEIALQCLATWIASHLHIHEQTEMDSGERAA